VKKLWLHLTANVPSAFMAALLLGGSFLLFVAWDQSHWWSQKEDYSFGWLVPLFVAYVLSDRGVLKRLWLLVRLRAVRGQRDLVSGSCDY
jgi:membrane protease YdiL (CAAX protease family)